MVCRSCGVDNAADALHCHRCWSGLGDAVTTPEEAEALRSVFRRARVRRRVAWAAAVLIVLGGAAWYAAGLVLSSPVPQPTTTATVILGPGAWTVPGGDLRGSSRAIEPDGPTGNELWRFATDGPGAIALAVADGVAYVATHDRRVLALGLADGAALWSSAIGNPAAAPPTATEDALYLGLRDGRLLALRRDDGRRWWSRTFDSNVTAAPVVKDGFVYVGLGNGKMLAVDAVTGQTLWSYEMGSWIGAAPVFAGDVMALLSQGGDIHFLDVVTGELRLDYSIEQLVQGAPGFAGDLLIVATDRGQMLALDARQVEYVLEDRLRLLRTQLYLWGLQDSRPTPKGEVWRHSVGDEVALRSPAIAEEAAYVVSEAGTLFAVRTESGDLLWSYEANAGVRARPIATESHVYIATEGGDVRWIARETGMLAGELTVGLPIADMLIVERTVLLVTTNGMLIAVR